MNQNTNELRTSEVPRKNDLLVAFIAELAAREQPRRRMTDVVRPKPEEFAEWIAKLSREKVERHHSPQHLH